MTGHRFNDPATREWIAAHDPLRVGAKHDPLDAAHGFPVASEYVATFWLPLLGPSSLWALRGLDRRVASGDGVVLVPLWWLAAELGLGQGVGKTSPVVKALCRLVDYSVAEVRGDTLVVATHLPRLPRHLERRLPAHLMPAHAAATKTLAGAR